MNIYLELKIEFLINLYPSFKMHGILHDVIQTTESILKKQVIIETIFWYIYLKGGGLAFNS